MRLRWLLPVVAFLSTLIAGGITQFYFRPHFGEEFRASAITLNLIMDTQQSNTPRLEVPGVFLMSATAAERALSSIQNILTKEVLVGDKAQCVDLQACKWLGINADQYGKSAATVVLKSATTWDSLADPAEQQDTNHLRSVSISISALVDKNARLVAGSIHSDNPINLSSISTRHDWLLASDDLSGLVLQQITGQDCRVRLQTTGARPADQMFVDLLQADTLSTIVKNLKYIALVAIGLSIIGYPAMSRFVLSGIVWLLLSAALSVIASRFIAHLGTLILGMALSTAICVIAKTWEPKNIHLTLAACLLGDALTGGYLASGCGLGTNPVAGARYYGVGNEQSALLVGVIVCLLPETLWLRTFIIGAAALMIGHPTLGANGGDMVAIILGFSVYIAMRLRRSGIRTLLMIGTAAVGVILWDAFMAPAELQSHMGRAVGTGLPALIQLLASKVSAHWRLMTSSAWGCAAVASAIWWYRNRKQSLTGLPLMIATAIFALNDSGPVSFSLFTLVLVTHPGQTIFTPAIKITA